MADIVDARIGSEKLRWCTTDGKALQVIRPGRADAGSVSPTKLRYWMGCREPPKDVLSPLHLITEQRPH